MNQFEVLEDGTVRESGLEAFSREIQSEYPSLDRLAWEGSAALARAYGTMQVLMGPVFEKADLTPARGAVLTHLNRRANKKLSIRALASAMNVTSGNVTQVVAGLERRHLVQRAKDPHDGRGTIVELTKQGSDMLQHVRPAQIERINRLWAGLADKEKTQLLHLLAKLRLAFLTSETPSTDDTV